MCKLLEFAGFFSVTCKKTTNVQSEIELFYYIVVVYENDKIFNFQICSSLSRMKNGNTDYEKKRKKIERKTKLDISKSSQVPKKKKIFYILAYIYMSKTCLWS